MKKFISRILILLLCLSMTACDKTAVSSDKADSGAPTETVEKFDVGKELDELPLVSTVSAQQAGSTPLFYKVTDGKGAVVWLMGSIHLGTEDMYPLPATITNAYQSADALAVECDIIAYEKDLSAQTQALQFYMYDDGSTIDRHIDKDLYDRAVQFLKEKNLYNDYLDYYSVSLWASMIEQEISKELKYDLMQGIDRYFLNLAKKQSKEIVEIESVEFQNKLMAGFSDELLALMLKETLDGYETGDAKQELDEMVALWRGGDEEKFADYLKEDTSDLTAREQELYEEYNKAMITDRNINMTDYAETALKSGKKVFICVGASHVVGEGAMTDLLRQRGYTVELVM